MKKELFTGLATVLMIFSMFEIASADYVLSPDSYSISPNTVRVPRENDLSLSMNMTLTNTSSEILYLDDFSFDLFEWDSGGPSSYDFIQSGPELFVTTKAPWPELYDTGPELSVTGQK